MLLKNTLSNPFETFGSKLISRYCGMSALLCSLLIGVISLAFQTKGKIPLHRDV